MNAPLNDAALRAVMALSEKWFLFAPFTDDRNSALIESPHTRMKAHGLRCALAYEDCDQNANRRAALPAGNGITNIAGLVLPGHTDVLPVDGRHGNKAGPLVMGVLGKKLPGRGVTDMKINSRSFLARLVRLWVTAAAAVTLLWLVTPADASPLTAADEKNVRVVVEGQLAALARDDANKAFSYAAPNVREAVGTAAGFVAMVRRHYPAIYRPASVAFLKPEGKDDQVIQRVQMLDAHGDSWLAIYSLQRQKDQAWRISGCAVVANKGRMA